MSSDAKDLQALRQRAAIPDYAELQSYEGFPASLFREGLTVSGRFALTPDEARAFEASAPGDGWLPLPILAELRAMIRFQGMSVNLDAADGYYRYRTAGDNVLYSSVSHPCQDVNQLSDIMLSVYERDTGVISAEVRSGY